MDSVLIKYNVESYKINIDELFELNKVYFERASTLDYLKMVNVGKTTFYTYEDVPDEYFISSILGGMINIFLHKQRDNLLLYYKQNVLGKEDELFNDIHDDYIVKFHDLHIKRVNVICKYFDDEHNNIDLIIPFIKIAEIKTDDKTKLHELMNEYKHDLDNKEKYISLIKYIKNIIVNNKEIYYKHNTYYDNVKKVYVEIKDIQFIEHNIDLKGNDRKFYSKLIDATVNDSLNIRTMLNNILNNIEF